MKVIIGGAGITGLAVGCYLQQKGIDFEIFEEGYQVPKVPVWRSTGIQLASNCHFVFKELGIYDQIKEASIERKNLKVYSEQNYLNNLSVTNDHDEGTFFIRRSELISILASLIPSQKISRSTSILEFHDPDIRGHDDHEKPRIEDYGTHVEVEASRLKQNPFDWATILNAENEIQNIEQQFESGLLTREEKYNKLKVATKHASKISRKVREWEPMCRHRADLYIDCTGTDIFRYEWTHKIYKQIILNPNFAVWGVSDYSDEMLKSFNNFMYSGMHFVTYPLTKNKTAFTLVMNNNFLLNALQLHPLQKGGILKYLEELVSPTISDEAKEGLFSNLYGFEGRGIEEQDRAREFINKLLKDKFKDLIDNLRYCSYGQIKTTAHNMWYAYPDEQKPNGKGNIIHLGDSAHAITPHLAQGAAQGLIDAAYLNRGFSANLGPEEHLHFRNSIINGEFFAPRDSIINKIRSQSNLNKNIYQLGMPFKLFRNIYLKLYKPNYDWLFNSKYDEA